MKVTTQSARELLGRCKTLLENSGYHLDDPQADHVFFRMELKKTCDAIDAYLAAPSASAMEMAEKIFPLMDEFYNNKISQDAMLNKAAALIEVYGRRVPRKAWEELWASAYAEGDVQPFKSDRDGEMARIAAKHGVVIE